MREGWKFNGTKMLFPKLWAFMNCRRRKEKMREDKKKGDKVREEKRREGKIN